MDLRVFFVCLLALFILGFEPRRVYDTIVESYDIVATALRNARQLARLQKQMRQHPSPELFFRLLVKDFRAHESYKLVRLVGLLLSLFLPLDVDRSARYLYTAVVLLILRYTLVRPRPPAQKQHTRRGSRIQPARTSEIPALLERLEAVDPDWENHTNDFLRSLLEELRGPITSHIIRFPVLSPMGGLYQMDALEGWFRSGGKTDPETRMPIDREAVVRRVPRVANLIEKILRQALREAAEARSRVDTGSVLARTPDPRRVQQKRSIPDRDVQQIRFEALRVPAARHPDFGRFIRDRDRDALLRALQRSGLTDQQKRQLLQGLDDPEKPVRVRQKQKKE